MSQERIDELTLKIAQVCVGCPHMKFTGRMECDRKKSQCHSKKVRAWLAEIDRLKENDGRQNRTRQS